MSKEMKKNTTEDYMEYQEGLEYPERVRNAVRYGYQYRKEAEGNKDSNIKYCLGDPSDIIYWIAQMIIGGLSWDLLKKAVKKMFKRIKKRGTKIDSESNELLTEETQLRTFYVYVKEFDEHQMSVDERTLKYIKEEIIADYVCDKIVKERSHNNSATKNEEFIKIFQEACIYADNMLNAELDIEGKMDKVKNNKKQEI